MLDLSAVRAFALALILSLLCRLLPLPFAAPPQPWDPDASGGPSLVAIQSASSGRYVEVAPDSWLYASSYSPNKPAAQFEVHPLSDATARVLLATREFREARAEALHRWDVRAGAPSEEAAGAERAEPLPDDDGDDSGWVLLRSAHGGGFVTVVGRAEEHEYVVGVNHAHHP